MSSLKLLSIISSSGKSSMLLTAGFASVAFHFLSKTITPSAMEFKIARLRPASIRSRSSDSARACVRSATTRSKPALISRSSLSAASRLRAESQETRARTKKPMMPNILTGRLIDAPSQAIIAPLIDANKKLACGARIKLAIVIGMVKRNRERPRTNSSAESVKTKMIVNSRRNSNAAHLPDHRRLIR